MFLQSRAQILSKIDALVTASDKQGDVMRAAVAFWGDGSQIMVRGQGRFELICNLAHPGTNPGVIENIMSYANVIFRQRDDLHAKVAISAGGAVVGSANFSEKALGLQMADVGGWLEAGYFIEPGTGPHTEVNGWFESIWADARIITPGDIEKAKLRWQEQGGAPMGPELFEEEVFEEWPLGTKSRNKIRMASRALIDLYFQAFPDRVENGRSVWVPGHTANLLWLLSGRITRSNIEGVPFFTTPAQVMDRARDLKTFDKVQAFMTKLASDENLKPTPSIRHWAKYGANLGADSPAWHSKAR